MKLVKVCRNGTIIRIRGITRDSGTCETYSVFVQPVSSQGSGYKFSEKEIQELVSQCDSELPEWPKKFLPLGFEVVND